jgi:hypothetical protein
MTTQAQKILQALKNNRGGIHPTYIIETLHIFQYNARIHELRKQYGCECKNGYRCSAQEHIVNKRLPNDTTLFVYEKSGENVDWEALRQDAISKRDNDTDTSLPLFS